MHRSDAEAGSRRFRVFSVVVNGPTVDPGAWACLSVATNAFSWFAFRLEVAPTTGQRHYQSVYAFRNAHTVSSARKLFSKLAGKWLSGDAVEPAIDRDALVFYVTDPEKESALGAPYVYGQLPKRKQKRAKSPDCADDSSLSRGSKRFKELVAEEGWEIDPAHLIVNGRGKLSYMSAVLCPPRTYDPVFVLWMSGLPACGKSFMCKLILDYVGWPYYEPPMRHKNSATWFTGYQGQPCVFLDELDADCFSPAVLKRLFQPGPVRMPSGQGGQDVNVSARIFFVTSQVAPMDFPWTWDDKYAIESRVNHLSVVCPDVVRESRISLFRKDAFFNVPAEPVVVDSDSDDDMVDVSQLDSPLSRGLISNDRIEVIDLTADLPEVDPASIIEKSEDADVVERVSIKEEIPDWDRKDDV